MSLIELNVSEFLDELASKSSAPGGGSAAALAGAMGLSLIAMACRSTIGKKKYADISPYIEAELAEIEVLRKKISALVDDDTAAFNSLMAARRLPNGTAEEKTVRENAIMSATKEAIRVPNETLRIAAEGLMRAVGIARFGNQNAISDIGSGVYLLDAACANAMLNVSVNLNDITDDTMYVYDVRNNASGILRAAGEWKKEAEQWVISRMLKK